MFRLKGLFKILLMEQVSFNSSEAGIPSTLAGSAHSLNATVSFEKWKYFAICSWQFLI